MKDEQVDIIENLRKDDKVKGYITGFFDAEGCVQINSSYILEVFITQSYIPVLEKINSVFKGHIGIHSKEGYDKRGVHRKGAWRHRLTSDDSIPFLEYIYSFSIEKRKQIKLAIEYQKNKDLLTLEQKQWYINEIKRLKHEQYDEKVLKNNKNEIRRLSVPKDVREQKQKTIFDETLEQIYERYGIDKNEEIEDDRYTIPEMPEDVLTGYVAGFFDGEGCVRINKGIRDNYTLTISITNSNFDILKLYEKRYGGKIRPHPKNKSLKEGHKDIWLWEAMNNDSLKIIREVYQFTLVKKEQIKLAIEFQEWHNTTGPIKTPEQKQKAYYYYNRLKELKKETGEEYDDALCDIHEFTGNAHQLKLEF